MLSTAILKLRSILGRFSSSATRTSAQASALRTTVEVLASAFTTEPPRVDGYTLLEVIGSGGAATVYKATRLVDQSLVAIKILYGTDPDIERNWMQEIEIVRMLQHPHIAKVYCSGEANSNRFIVMEYVDKGSLRQHLKSGKPVPINFARAVVGQTCEGLAYAHSQRVLHLDIKPDNILLSGTEGVKIVDFGISQIIGTIDPEDRPMFGTPYYMSYEQAARQPVTAASDVYSVGIMLYEMLTGTWPFTGGPYQVIDKHCHELPRPPRQLNRALPIKIERVVMRALEKDVTRRYASVMELADDLGYRVGTKLKL